jgi:hypothetical protein
VAISAVFVHAILYHGCIGAYVSPEANYPDSFLWITPSPPDTMWGKGKAIPVTCREGL